MSNYQHMQGYINNREENVAFMIELAKLQLQLCGLLSHCDLFTLDYTDINKLHRSRRRVWIKLQRVQEFCKLYAMNRHWWMPRGIQLAARGIKEKEVKWWILKLLSYSRLRVHCSFLCSYHLLINCSAKIRSVFKRSCNSWGIIEITSLLGSKMKETTKLR